MSYTNETTYYGLPLPTGSDKSTFTDNNTAFQAVDAALHTAYEQSGAATEDIVAIKATVANLIQADINFQNDLDTEKGKIVNLQDKEVLQDAAIAAVKADAQDMVTAYNEPTATSTHAYSIGDYFIYNDVLYRATESITIGDTIVPDTNCVTTNVSTELLQIKSDLSRQSTTLSTESIVGTVSVNSVEKSGNDVTISFYGQATVGANESTKIATIPENYRPDHLLVIPAIDNSNHRAVSITIDNSNGAVSLYTDTSVTAAYIAFNASYVV